MQKNTHKNIAKNTPKNLPKSAEAIQARYESFKSTSGYGRGLWTLILGLFLGLSALSQVETIRTSASRVPTVVEPLPASAKELVQYNNE